MAFLFFNLFCVALVCGKENREVVTSKPFDFIDLPSIHEYGWATFGLKLADYFITEIYASLEELSKIIISIQNADI